MKYIELISENEAELKILEIKQKHVKFQTRLRFLLLLKSGTANTQKKAGEAVGWKLRQSQKIWRLYQEQGINDVLRKNASWQTGKLSREQHRQLQEHLAQTGGASSLLSVQSHIAANFGVRYSIGGVSNLCRQLNIKLKDNRRKCSTPSSTHSETSL